MIGPHTRVIPGAAQRASARRRPGTYHGRDWRAGHRERWVGPAHAAPRFGRDDTLVAVTLVLAVLALTACATAPAEQPHCVIEVSVGDVEGLAASCTSGQAGVIDPSAVDETFDVTAEDGPSAESLGRDLPASPIEDRRRTWEPSP